MKGKPYSITKGEKVQDYDKNKINDLQGNNRKPGIIFIRN